MDATRRRFVRSRSATIQGELIRFAEDATVRRETRIPADSSLPLLRNQPKPLRLCRLNGRLTLGASSFRDALNAPYTTQQPLSRFARTHSPTYTQHARTHVHTGSRACERKGRSTWSIRDRRERIKSLPDCCRLL